MSALDLKQRALDLRASLYDIARDHASDGAESTAADYRAAARMIGELSAELGRTIVYRDSARRERDALERAQAARDAAQVDAENCATIARALRDNRRDLKRERDGLRDKIVDLRARLEQCERERDGLSVQLSGERVAREQCERDLTRAKSALDDIARINYEYEFQK